MAGSTDNLIPFALRRSLSSDEMQLLADKLRELENGYAERERAHLERIATLERELAELRRLFRKYDLNQIMD